MFSSSVLQIEQDNIVIGGAKTRMVTGGAY